MLLKGDALNPGREPKAGNTQGQPTGAPVQGGRGRLLQHRGVDFPPLAPIPSVCRLLCHLCPFAEKGLASGRALALQTADLSDFLG